MKKQSLLLWSIIIWLIFVVSLATWWMIFSLRTIRKLGEFVSDESIKGQHTMLLTEGGVLIALLIIGGTLLIYFAIREKNQFEHVRLFFTTFTHDMKTSISRLLLQSEVLNQKASVEDIKVFRKNIIALEFQLENSLNLAQFGKRATHIEKTDIKSIVTRLHQYWPDIKITITSNKSLFTDAVGLESVLRNIISNAMIHAKADEFKIKVEEHNNEHRLTITDNGKSTAFDFSNAGYSLSPSLSGSGLGLYLIRQWMDKLQGKIEFKKSSNSGLEVVLTLPLIKGAP